MERDNLKCGHRPLQESCQAGEGGLSELARSAVFVVLKPLEPDSGADLMYSLADLQIVLVGKQIPMIRDARGIVRASGSDRPVGGCCGAASHDNPTSPCPCDKGKAGRECGQGDRSQAEGLSGKSNTEYIYD